jgi:osmotically-inducible protein OsmY
MNTDQEIQSQVLAALEWEPAVHAEHIGISVTNGVVTLQGFVTSIREKFLAERIAGRVHSVRAIANDIEVTPDGLLSRSDTAIAEAVANAMEWDSAIPDGVIKATVRKGWVTLNGTVGWQYEKAAAERAVKNLHGVQGLSNQIVVSPAVDIGNVKADIERAFKRSAEVDATNVHVSVIAPDRTVVLTGKVRSLSERDAAERAAWAAPGVRAVDDRLVIAS